ncbi:MAG: hypothetical protein R3246_13575, partial [Acidimicrobiia bacterium]|nr:hypothetical protein [Acidimicrobiia bacterium]
MEPVVLELGSRRVFASSLRFPGWSRSSKTGDAALDQLDAYRARFGEVCAIAGVDPPGQPLDGVDLTPLLRRPARRLERNALYFHYPHYHHSRPAGAVRM